MRQILIKVWQGILTPRRALRDFRRIGVIFGPEKEKAVMDLLLALKEKQATVTEVEQELKIELGEEGVSYEEENLCQT